MHDFGIVLFLFVIILLCYVLWARNEIRNKKNVILLQDEKISLLEKKLADLGYEEYSQVLQAIFQMNKQLIQKERELDRLSDIVFVLQEDEKKKEKNVQNLVNKIAKNKTLLEAVQYAISAAVNYNEQLQDVSAVFSEKNKHDLEELLPTVQLKYNAMNVADLRKAMRDNDKEIEKVLKEFEKRYDTKANKAIYHLTVIALKAELQNVLVSLKYDKLETSLETIRELIKKYVALASEGSQLIAPTLLRFLGMMEYLFLNAVRIEYNYYVKREQAKQEQLLLREQMRQEAEERKALEAERKKVQQEEEKYLLEIEKTKEKIQAAGNLEESELLKERLLVLQKQLEEVEIKKEEIINLQNGKAGTVYIISNLGSFGENVFKVGMTRRLEPMDRVKELGDASVPFKFDVHSFIFSDDAVSLENELHRILNEKRVNKVNRRKEFFKVSIEELEKIVLDIQPSAEFNKTMLAEEYNQSLSVDGVYSEECAYPFEDEDE